MKNLSSYITPSCTLLFAGDAMQHDLQLHWAAEKDYDYSEYWVNVKKYIESADYSIVNLETTLSGKPYTGFPRFSAPVSYAESLKQAGFDLFLTANNHCLDYGAFGLRQTINHLDELGVAHIGTYKNPGDTQSYIIEKNGIKIGFLNYTAGCNNAGTEMKLPEYTVSKIKIEKVLRDIHAMRPAVDVLVCCLHFGREYFTHPTPEQKNLVHILQGAGADLIIGSHPHVISTLEYDEHKLVAYSLGNFMAYQTTPYVDFRSRGGMMLKIDIVKNSNGITISAVEPILTYIDKRADDFVLATKLEEVSTENRDEFKAFISDAKKILNIA